MLMCAERYKFIVLWLYMVDSVKQRTSSLIKCITVPIPPADTLYDLDTRPTTGSHLSTSKGAAGFLDPFVSPQDNPARLKKVEKSFSKACWREFEFQFFKIKPDNLHHVGWFQIS